MLPKQKIFWHLHRKKHLSEKIPIGRKRGERRKYVRCKERIASHPEFEYQRAVLDQHLLSFVVLLQQNIGLFYHFLWILKIGENGVQYIILDKFFIFPVCLFFSSLKLKTTLQWSNDSGVTDIATWNQSSVIQSVSFFVLSASQESSP